MSKQQLLEKYNIFPISYKKLKNVDILTTGSLFSEDYVILAKENINVNDISTMPVVYDTNSINNQIMNILSKNIYYGILPVVDGNNVLNKCVTLVDNTWEEDSINSLSKLYYLENKEIDISYYFTSRNIHRIIFWGGE
mgnify:CR=1 FL=1